MNMIERIKMVRCMEFIMRNLNDEDILMHWLSSGVADGDIQYGDLCPGFRDEYDLEYYFSEDKDFADLMGLFIDLVSQSRISGGLYCDGVVSSRDDTESVTDPLHEFPF